MIPQSDISEQARQMAKTRWERATPEERSAHAKMMRSAQKPVQERFYDMVDPRRELDEETREELAGIARKLYYAKVSAKRRQTMARKRAEAKAESA